MPNQINSQINNNLLGCFILSFFLFYNIFLFNSSLAEDALLAKTSTEKEQTDSICNQIEHLKLEVSGLRGLPFLNNVPCLSRNKKEVEEYLDYLLSKDTTAKKLNKEEIIFKALGIIPSDYDYKNGLIKLYKDQIGGYYDPEKKYYAMASWVPDRHQDVIAIHELTHALQDQHFDLENLMDESLFSDEIVARSALAEGDATIVMTDYSRKNVGMASVSSSESVSSFMIQTIIGASFGGSMKDAPPALQALMLFPYISGFKFAHSLLKVGGFEAINESIKNPPRGSSEILHPEKYLERINGNFDKSFYKKINSCDSVPSFKDQPFSLVHEDNLGEFGTTMFFIANGRYLNNDKGKKPSNISSEWEDDRICFFESDEKIYLYWEHYWKSQKAKDAFINYVIMIFRNRFSLVELELNNSYNIYSKHNEVETFRISSQSDVRSQISFIIKK